MRAIVAILALAMTVPTGDLGARQLSPAGRWTATAADRVQVLPNLTYRTVGTWNGRLDLYLPIEASSPTPVLVWFHGGGWTKNSKEAEMLYILPYLEVGWAVVNVEYRLADVALAPAAVDDCRCALRWVLDNAQDYKLDTHRVVLSGISAGGHLALATGLLTREAGLDPACDLPADRGPAAVVNWFGPADVANLVEGPHAFDQAQTWLGARPDRLAVARAVSPVHYVRPGAPPVITIHGDRDDVIPYAQSVRLHEALRSAKVANELVTIRGGGHGEFGHGETLRAYSAIRRFLRSRGLLP